MLAIFSNSPYITAPIDIWYLDEFRHIIKRNICFTKGLPSLKGNCQFKSMISYGPHLKLNDFRLDFNGIFEIWYFKFSTSAFSMVGNYLNVPRFFYTPNIIYFPKFAILINLFEIRYRFLRTDIFF